jgi:hypothetical protein
MLARAKSWWRSHALIAYQRYAHAKLFKRARRGLRRLPHDAGPRHARRRPQDQGQRGLVCE